MSKKSPDKIKMPLKIATSCCKIEILKKMKEELQMKNVGWRLREIRNRLNMSQEEFGQVPGLKRSSLEKPYLRFVSM
jgi:DNA-binding transcriptional regulator YiaG